MSGLDPATHAPAVVQTNLRVADRPSGGWPGQPGHDGLGGGITPRYPSTTFFSAPFSTGGYRRSSQIISPIEGQAANVQMM